MPECRGAQTTPQDDLSMIGLSKREPRRRFFSSFRLVPLNQSYCVLSEAATAAWKTAGERKPSRTLVNDGERSKPYYRWRDV